MFPIEWFGMLLYLKGRYLAVISAISLDSSREPNIFSRRSIAIPHTALHMQALRTRPHGSALALYRSRSVFAFGSDSRRGGACGLDWQTVLCAL